MTTFKKSSKQLAIEKGIFRQRGLKRKSRKTTQSRLDPSSIQVPLLSSSSSASSSSLLTIGSPDSSATNTDVRYLIVIDFESTCWPDAVTERLSYQRVQHPQEIIEFPAVVVDLRSGHVDVENSFHTYVQPEEQPTLSSFCTRLTGIAQSTVDDGIPLRAVLPRFNKWLRDVQTKFDCVFAHFATTTTKSSCSIATWTDWDLGRMLHNECKRKGLRHPPELTAWVDLKLVYKDFYGRKPAGLNGALKDAGLVFAGREHSGIDDAVNTAKLAARMCADGCVIRQTKGLQGILTKK